MAADALVHPECVQQQQQQQPCPKGFAHHHHRPDGAIPIDARHAGACVDPCGRSAPGGSLDAEAWPSLEGSAPGVDERISTRMALFERPVHIVTPSDGRLVICRKNDCYSNCVYRA